jgi:hypothetical protein
MAARLIGLLAVAGCKGIAAPDVQSQALVALSIQPQDPTISLSDSIDLWVVGITAEGDTQAVATDVEWTVTPGSVKSTGNGKGRYKPDRPGRHRVAARADSLTDTTVVTVVDTTVASVEVTPATTSVGVGGTVRLTATPRDSLGNVVTGIPLTWSSSPTAVASVSASGLVTAKAAGTVTITVTSQAATGSATVAVTENASGPVDFASDWTTATGAAAAALTDNGAWPEVRYWGTTDGGVSPGAKVIDDVDFPSGRAFSSGYHGASYSTGETVTSNADLKIGTPYSKWSVPAVGQTLFHRFYLKNTVDAPRFGRNLNRGSHHPFQGWGNDPALGGNCAFHWEYRFDARTDGTFTWEVANLRFAGSWTKSGLALGRVYLMEVAYTRTDTFRWTVRVRLDGVELGTVLAEAEIGTTCLGTLFIGNNDPGSGAGDTDPGRWRNSNGSSVPGGPHANLDAMRWGPVAVAVRDDPDAWIGAYVR